MLIVILGFFVLFLGVFFSGLVIIEMLFSFDGFGCMGF